MFESFVIMLREGVEAALVVGILLVVLRQSGRRHLERPVFLGLGLAVVASIAAAVALRLLPLNEEAYEGVLYSVSAVFVATMMWWVHRNARKLRGQIEQRVRHAAEATPERSAKEAWGLGAFAFLMIFREGAETVMLLSAVNLTTEAMFSFIGTLLGLVGAVVFGVMFVRGSLHVSVRRFFAVTEWVLAIFVVQLLINGYHEFSEAGVVPATRRSMALIGPAVSAEMNRVGSEPQPKKFIEQILPYKYQYVRDPSETNRGDADADAFCVRVITRAFGRLGADSSRGQSYGWACKP